VRVPSDARDTHDPHQLRDLVPADVMAGLAHRDGELVGPMETAVGPPDIQRDVRHVNVGPFGAGARLAVDMALQAQ